MKKQFGLPLMLASALAFSACSSDDVADNGGKDISALTDGGYLKMSINLPSRAANGGFRATEDQTGHVTLEDGLAKEYNVKDAILVLFEGVAGNEGEAVFHSAYDITTSMQLEGTTTDQITSTTKLVQKVNKGGDANKVDPANTLYALVILNNNGKFKVAADHDLQYESVDKVEGTMATSSFAGKKFSDFQKLKANGGCNSFYGDDKKGILMMNAPLYGTAATSTTAPSGLATLAVVTNKVKNTETAAQNEPGAEVFVERAVAKVTMDKNIAKTKLQGTEYDAAHANQVDVELIAWGLDYTNNISYYMHNAKPVTTTIADWVTYKTNGDAATENYRFAGTTRVKDGYGYRAYWGEDPNYAADPKTGSTDLWGSVSNYDGKDKNFTHLGALPTLSKDFTENHPQYCMENTFNVANMNEDQTTRAIVKVKLTPNTKDADGSFYIVNNDKSKFFDLAGINTLVEQHVKACNTVANKVIKDAVTAVVVSDIDFDYDATGTNMTVKSFKVSYDGTVVNYTVGTPGAPTAVDEVNDALKQVTKYDKGFAYYPIRIKHFGSSKALAAGGYEYGLVTWDANKHTQADRYDNNNEQKFLGRYGVLRNNWYDLGINSISGVGSPIVPDAPSTPDDELESFISVRINVLSWAKRVQREDL
jgi:hypothetical protein